MKPETIINIVGATICVGFLVGADAVALFWILTSHPIRWVSAFNALCGMVFIVWIVLHFWRQSRQGKSTSHAAIDDRSS